MERHVTIWKALLSGVVALGALACVAVAAIYVRDGRTIQRANAAVRSINEFCSTKGRLPDAVQFATMFPDMSINAGWFYRSSPDERHATLQYPMAAMRAGAPGVRKISEFTATTYGYEVRLSGAPSPSQHLVQDPYRLIREDRGWSTGDDFGKTTWRVTFGGH